MAGSKKDSFENALLLLIFNNTTISGIGSDGLRGSTTAGNLYVALFSSGVTDAVAGTEITYTGYARVAVVRSSAGWTIAGNNASNAALVTFGLRSDVGSVTANQFVICKGGTRDTDDGIYWADLTAPLAISQNITPEFAIGDLDVNEE